MTVCAVPNCGRALSRGARSGVCRNHNHAAGFCQCSKCGNLPSVVETLAHAVVQVPVHSTYSGISATRPVSLKKAPWDE